MPILTTCPHCQSKLRVADNVAGKKVRCGRCKDIFVALADSEAIRIEPAPPAVATPTRKSDKPTPDVASDFEDEPEEDELEEDAPAPRPTKKKTSLGRVLINLAAGIGAGPLALFIGLPVFLVMALSFMAGLPMYFLTRGDRRRMVPAGAVQAGHALWMLLGAYLVAIGSIPGMQQVAPPDLFPIFVEGFLYLIGAVLVVMFPHWPVIALLTFYQVIAVFTNSTTLFEPEIAPVFRKALVLHICLRCLAVALMFEAAIAASRERREAAPSRRHEPPEFGDIESPVTSKPHFAVTIAFVLVALFAVVGGVAGLYLLLQPPKLIEIDHEAIKRQIMLEKARQEEEERRANERQIKPPTRDVKPFE